MRNLCDECMICLDNGHSMAECMDNCGVPSDLLEHIEDSRNKKQVVIDIVMNSKTEYLETNLSEWLSKRREILK